MCTCLGTTRCTHLPPLSDGSAWVEIMINLNQRRASNRRRRVWPVTVMMVAGLLVNASESVAQMETNSQGRTLDELIQALVTSAPRGHAAVETVTGVRLSPTSSGLFDDYVGHSIRLHGATVQSIEFREPRANGEVTSGPIVVLTLGNECVERDHIFEHYERLSMIDEPRADRANDPSAVDEGIAFATDEPWGRLTFGFSGRSPNCVATVTIALKKL